ncbi:hypothetical protein ACNVED_11610 [Legionella sp. D16C41]|uniref:hypothetical protein n=1 Tax=Legionella sp. D16C41 TaxID=3402688 RepID=UPI003AF4F2E5
MKQYIWYHPFYVAETSSLMVNGQMENARKHGYIVLETNQLGKVKSNDHLTIVGHSTPPKALANKNSKKSSALEDAGYFIQGETAEECINRLFQNGLKKAPRVLSLECCKAAIIPNGIAEQLSKHPFLVNVIIEANTSAVGRNTGNILWTYTPDSFGRVVMKEANNPWVFLLAGKQVFQALHGTYKLNEVIEEISKPKEDIAYSRILSPRLGIFKLANQANEKVSDVPKMRPVQPFDNRG